MRLFVKFYCVYLENRVLENCASEVCASFIFPINVNLARDLTKCKIANYDTDYIFLEGTKTGSKQSDVV